MRVTHTIRDYIQKRVEQAYPIPEVVLEEQRRNDEMAEKSKDLSNRMEALIQEKFGEELKELREYCNELGFKVDYSRPNVFIGLNYSRFNTSEDNIRVKADKARSVRREKIANKVDDICITLELGCTKDQLEEILAAIEFEE